MSNHTAGQEAEEYVGGPQERDRTAFLGLYLFNRSHQKMLRTYYILCQHVPPPTREGIQGHFGDRVHVLRITQPQIHCRHALVHPGTAHTTPGPQSSQRVGIGRVRVETRIDDVADELDRLQPVERNR